MTRLSMTRSDKKPDRSSPPVEPGPPAHTEGPSAAPFDWRDYVDALIAERGSLAALAAHLCERRNHAEDQGSVERGLRRLRERGSRPGGVWGDRALRCFGLPGAVSDRVRWMGQYHTRFTDLPVPLAQELLRPWDRPPLSEGPERVWILLGQTSLALRRRDPEGAAALLEQAALLDARCEPTARVELALVEAFVYARRHPVRAGEALERASALLDEHREALERDAPEDYACLFARLIDQRAYPLNKPPKGHGRPVHHVALVLYQSIPEDGPPFARCRRHNGMGWTHLHLGEGEAARRHALASVRAAGDSGSLRMRAMALNLLAATLEARHQHGDARQARARAQAIAARLEDEALRLRFRSR